MRLKSNFADTIEEAIGQARRELGPEAMLVKSKRSGAEARHLGMYDVVSSRRVKSRRVKSILRGANISKTQTFGPILSLSVRTAKPLSYLSGGQPVPEDLEPAARGMVLDLAIKAARADESKFGSAAA